MKKNDLLRMILRANNIGLGIALLSTATLAQLQNVDPTTSSEIKHYETVSETASLAWKTFRTGKTAEMNLLLQSLRETPNDPHTDVRKFALEQVDLIQARVNIQQGQYSKAAHLLELHLRYSNGDLQLGSELTGIWFRFADLAICLEKTHRYPAALRIYRAGLRTLMDGSRTEVVSEPIPLIETFDSGLNGDNTGRFEAACYLMAAISGQQNGDEDWMIGYADEALLADPTWELAHFYASYLPLQFTNFPTRNARKATYDMGIRGCRTKAYQAILTNTYNYIKVNPIAYGKDLRSSSKTLHSDLKETQSLKKQNRSFTD